MSGIPQGIVAQPDKHMLTCDLNRLRREVDDMTKLLIQRERGGNQIDVTADPFCDQ